MYQICPVCNGRGVVDSTQMTTVTIPCSVCHGAKIIDQSTGLPPSTGNIRYSNEYIQECNKDNSKSNIRGLHGL